MIRKLYAALFASVAVFGALAALAPSASAIDVFQACGTNSDTAVCRAQSTDNASSLVGSIISALMWVIGAVSVIMIVVAGIKYTTSNGDANKIQSAKNTLLYAVIGVAVAILGQAIVLFVVNRITSP